jgi:uncharacterized protein
MMILVTGQIRSLEAAAHAPNASPTAIAQWKEMADFISTTPRQTTRQVAVYRSGPEVRIRETITNRGLDPLIFLPMMTPETLALMLLGMAAFRSGFLTGEWEDAAYRKVAAWTLGLGIPASIALALDTMLSNFFVPKILFNFLVMGTPLRPLTALGYAALVILAFRRSSALRDRVAAVGRCAFSNYLGTSLLASLIFYGGGLALFGTLSRWQAWLFVPLFWALMLAWSKPWLDRFNYGPLEWLWRTLARMKLQPMRK